MSVFFKDFLSISEFMTIAFILGLGVMFFIMWKMRQNKASFSKRVLVATILGLLLGLVIQIVAKFPKSPEEVVFIKETTTWYGLLGYGFMDLIKMLVIPLIITSIIHVIINMEEGIKLGKLVRNTLVVTLSMVAISAVLGLVLGIIFNLGVGMSSSGAQAEIKEVSTIVSTLRHLLPSNPVQAMVELNVIALVIFAAFFGIGAKRMSKKYMPIVKPFYDLINALQKIIISIAMTVISLMPYAVIPLLANTIALRGLDSIKEVGKFILVLYLTLAIMFVLQVLVLLFFKINPKYYLKKSVGVFALAFNSRSSVGTLPLTIDTLTNKLGVSGSSANFVASFGTTAGMQGCAGVFPALLLVFVANLNGTPIDFSFFIMAVIVITIGSLGIAGIPGTATMAASVSLTGVGMASSFQLVSPILAIDPLIDMGRTLLNVSGSMVNTLIVDKTLGQFDEKKYTNFDYEE